MNDALKSCLHWVREREAVRERKARCDAYPWTDDEIIGTYRFCNVRREDDRVTVWVRENIRKPFADHPHLWFMLCTARQINWPDALQELIDKCWPTHVDFSPKLMGAVLEERAQRGDKVFTGAYNITAPPTKGVKKTHWVADHTLGALWKDRERIGEAIAKATTLRQAHATIMKYDCWGPFMAYQAVVDMRFCDNLLANANDISIWAAAGPGTIRGLNRIAGRPLDFKLDQRFACAELVRLAPVIRNETGVEFDFTDVPNIMCETDKYIRVLKGEGKPRATYVPGRGS